MKIVLYCPGNLNFGDNAILHNWLSFYNKILTSEDFVTVFGVETSFIMWHASEYRFRIACSNVAHRYFWHANRVDSNLRKLLEDLVETEDFSAELFLPDEYMMHDVLQDCDFLHILGGGCINNLWRDVHYSTFGVVKLAKKYGKKVILTGQTIGPLDAQDEERLEALFSSVDLVDLRDKTCYAYLKRICSNTMITCDDVLLDFFSKPCLSERMKKWVEESHITVCFQQWALSEEDNAAYDEALRNTARFIDKYSAEHPEVKVDFLELAPLDFDMKQNQKIYSLLSDPVKERCNKICLANFKVEEGIALIQSASFSIGSRFHLALFSMAKAIPSVSLVLDWYYDVKLRGVHTMFQSDRCIPMREFTVENIEKALQSEVALEESLPEIAFRGKKKLEAMYDVLRPAMPLQARIRMKKIIREFNRGIR